jgi:HD-GYP domain-containing protein (c-di-GMP phosphodiesterase class II)
LADAILGGSSSELLRVSKRSYKDAFLNERVYAMLQQAHGSHFDPKILDIFFSHLNEVTTIQKRYPDAEWPSLLAAA